ncbi:hypothetical protein MNBD_BACTEROID05-494, partial [hydrothermal vent metagenome]
MKPMLKYKIIILFFIFYIDSTFAIEIDKKHVDALCPVGEIKKIEGSIFECILLGKNEYLEDVYYWQSS